MQERYISSGSSRLHIAVWEPSGERKAIMQISHGMIEYIKRYSHFANYLNQAGILVIGNDHKGHGLTAEKDEDLAFLFRLLYCILPSANQKRTLRLFLSAAFFFYRSDSFFTI